MGENSLHAGSGRTSRLAPIFGWKEDDACMGADHVTRFARVDFRGDDRVFGIKDEDRFSHVYIVGKTGTGKSTLLENMALQDVERGHGFALIDPHGDLVRRIVARVPEFSAARHHLFGRH